MNFPRQRRETGLEQPSICMISISSARQCIDCNQQALLQTGEPSNSSMWLGFEGAPGPLNFALSPPEGGRRAGASHFGVDVSRARGVEEGKEHKPPLILAWTRTANLSNSSRASEESEHNGRPPPMPTSTTGVQRRRARASCDLCRRMKVRPLDS